MLTNWQRKERRHHYRQRRADRDQATMRTGPFLLDDGHTLVIPSAWYNPDAVRIWSAQGLRYNSTGRQWSRDTREPLRGKCYAADAWLQSARQHFYKLYHTEWRQIE